MGCYCGSSNTYGHWSLVRAEASPALTGFFNIAFVLHHQFFNWAAVPGEQFSSAAADHNNTTNSNNISSEREDFLKS
jgi:hypothetical protein